MNIDIDAARQFIHANGRVLERHRLATLLDGAPTEPLLTALRAYRNPDGGFGHALEPDVRCPGSQPAATLQALEVMLEAGVTDDPMLDDAARWVAAVALADGGVPTVLPSADGHPRAPWMEPGDVSGFLTFALAGKLWQAGVGKGWLDAASEWCWRELEGEEPAGGYTVKFAIDFLDAVPDPPRAAAALERLRPALDADGCLDVPGGTENERLTPLDFSPHPGLPSRALFTDAQIRADLDRLEAGQREDGGWTVEYLQWSPGAALDWRGIATVLALGVLRANGRLAS
ncbi:hypothetical protein [Nocardioides bizhenqiangii]|uniref:Prenyltransferase n=1 Tax=Nocardioides bizhenqiangii TaxID=3095076 RepID=A0ABZ0ZNI1_9ACTN|nr:MULTISPECIES: hypothetical protein [unclassified Nocardioides]MDZ5620977.1 hypothetical protein [Nocardioides sp. HM23]WQQ25336.1 hypothetical protein SHK19_15355 [Nocardioides sp. HM61]